MSDVEQVDQDVIEVDEGREALLSELADELGGDIVESFVKPGDDVWIRVSREAWVPTADVLKNRLGYEFFNFLSAIDWLPSPFGRDTVSYTHLTLPTNREV